MSIEGQGHFFTIYFPGFVCFVLYWAKISGEPLQDHWSSGFSLSPPERTAASALLSTIDLINQVCMIHQEKMCLGFRPGQEDIKLFSCSTQLSMKLILLINVKMPMITIVSTSAFISRINDWL